MAGPVLIAISDIEIEGLMRRPRGARVTAIAAEISREGQWTPIEVAPLRKEGERQIYRLTTGWVRIEALKALRQPEVRAIIKRATLAERRRREIDDNLLADGLTVLDRARYLAARKALYEQDHPETAHGGHQDAKSGIFVARSTPAFKAWAAAAYGVSARSVQRAYLIGETLDPLAADTLAESDWADHQSALETIARLEAGKQLAVAELLTRDPDPIATLAEALHIAGAQPPPLTSTKRMSAILGNFGALGLREQRLVANELAMKLGARLVYEAEAANDREASA